MNCIGKFQKGSGIEDALVETKAFELKVIESVLGGSNYVRALRGLLIVAEAVESMKWDAFWMTRDRNDFVFERSALSDLLLSLQDKDPAATKSDFQTCIKSTKLKEDLQEFSKQSSESSDICRYWEGLLQNVNHLEALIAADRGGDWEGQLLAVQNLLPIYRECNYLCYASLYLETMRKLPQEHPDIYEKFSTGHFVDWQNRGSFNAVSPDMKLE